MKLCMAWWHGGCGLGSCIAVTPSIFFFYRTTPETINKTTNKYMKIISRLLGERGAARAQDLVAVPREEVPPTAPSKAQHGTLS